MSRIPSLPFYEINPENQSSLKQLFFDNKIVHIQNERPLSLEEIKSVCHIFGLIFKNEEDSKFNVDGDASIQRVSNNHDQLYGLFENFELNWHNDFAHTPGEFHGTALYNQHNAQATDTVFCDTEAGFQELPESLVQQYKDLQLAHAPRENAFLNTNLSPAEKRLLRLKKCKIDGHFSHACFHENLTYRKLFQEHPITKKNSIYLSPATIDREPIKADFLNLLTACTKVTFSHQWQENDLLLFDNLSLMHSRKSFSGNRVIYRTQFNYDYC